MARRGGVKRNQFKQEGGQGKDRPQAHQKKAAAKGNKGKGKGSGQTKHEKSVHPPSHQQYEKVPGTKIQSFKGGVVRRVAIATGKDFAPNDIQTCLQHIEKHGGGGGGGRRAENFKASKGATSKGSKGGQRGGQRNDNYVGQGKVIKEVTKKVNGQFIKEIWVEKGSGKGNSRKRGGATVSAKSVARSKFTAGVIKKNKQKNQAGDTGKGGRSKRGGRRFRKDGKERKERTPEQIEAFKEKQQKRHEKKVEEEGRELVSDETYTGEVLQRGKFSAWVKPDGGLPGDFEAKLSEMNSKIRSKTEKGRKFCGGTTDDVLYVAIADIADDKLVLKRGLKVSFKIYTDKKGVGGCDITKA